MGASTSPTEPRGTSEAQLQLAGALRADTGPAALLAALRSRSQRVTRLGTQTVDGSRGRTTAPASGRYGVLMSGWRTNSSSGLKWTARRVHSTRSITTSASRSI